MAGLDISKIPKPMMNDMLQDVMVELEALRVFEKFSTMKKVTAREGNMLDWTTPMDVPTDGHRKSRVAPGAETPMGDAEMGSIPYKVHDYKFGIPLEESVMLEIQSHTDVKNKLIKKTVMQLLLDQNLDWKAALTAASNVTTMAVGTPWTNPAADIIATLDAIALKFRGLQNLIVIVGFDVMQNLSSNRQFTGNEAGSGKNFISFDEVKRNILSRGFSDVILDGTAKQDTEGHYGREYAGAYDGLFTVTTKETLCRPVMKPIKSWSYTDEGRDIEVFKSKEIAGQTTGKKEHILTLTGLAA